MWFERLMGFEERSPEQVRASIALDGAYLVSRVNGTRVRCGTLTTPSLAELRASVSALPARNGETHVDEVVGDVGALHRDPKHAGALFQAASQFNLLEMNGPDVTPEEGVGIYEHDPTQGPACAVACGGGTIYRNYFAPVGAQLGQTASHQIDCLTELGEALGQPGPYTMRNGYALANAAGLRHIAARLRDADETTLDHLRGLLRIGVQHEVEVLGTNHTVHQAYCAALPVAYGNPSATLWEPFARLVLEATYEATLLAARRYDVDEVFLTRVGGGVFGNDPEWINDALLRALRRVPGLRVHLVSYGRSDPMARRVVSHAR